MVFVGFSTALVFFRKHLIPFSICAGRAISKLGLWLYGVENLTLANTFLFCVRRHTARGHKQTGYLKQIYLSPKA
jgi:hypothetical protein